MSTRLISVCILGLLAWSCEEAKYADEQAVPNLNAAVAADDGSIGRPFTAGVPGDLTAETSKLDDPLFKKSVLHVSETSLSGAGFVALKRVNSLITAGIQDLAKMRELAAASVAVYVFGDERVTAVGKMQLTLGTSTEPVAYLMDESRQPIALSVRSADGVNATLDVITTKNLVIQGDMVTVEIDGFGVYQIAWIKTPPEENMHFELGPLSASGLGDLSRVVGSVPGYTGPTILCRSYDAGTEVGQLDAAMIAESSGMAVSTKYPDRLYHINDGADASIYVTSLTGTGTKKIAIEGFTPVDIEFLSVGPCFAGKSCLFVGDFGDNDLSRAETQLAVIVEPEELVDSLSPARVVSYTGMQRDIEAGAVHPVDGNVYLMEKLNPKELKLRIDLVTHKLINPNLNFHILDKKDWESEPSSTEQKHPVYKAVFEILELPTVPALNFLAFKPSWLEFDPLAAEPSPFISKFVTDMSISSDGKRLMVATYGNMLEFDYDLSGPEKHIASMTPVKEIQVNSVTPLAQQESVTYLPDGKSFLYSTEIVSGKTTTAPLMKVQCHD